MAEPHVITSLSKKRAELSGDIERMQRELTDAISALEKLDATLLLFDPDYEIASIKPKAFRPPENWSKRGEMTWLILGILRKATEPLTSSDIAAQLAGARPVGRNAPKTDDEAGSRGSAGPAGQGRRSIV